MRPLHERFLAGIAEERQRLATRRGFLAGSAKLAGGGALALAVGGGLGIRRFASAQELASDLDVLNYALTLEHLENSFYRDGLDAIGDAFDGGVFDNLAVIGDHEAAHVVALTDTITQLGGDPVPEAEYDFGDAFDDPDAFLATAMALENTGVRAYDGAGQFLTDTGLLTVAGGIVAVEARHASYLNELNGEVPFPSAFEDPATPAEILEIAGPFIVS